MSDALWDSWDGYIASPCHLLTEVELQDQLCANQNMVALRQHLPEPEISFEQENMVTEASLVYAMYINSLLLLETFSAKHGLFKMWLLIMFDMWEERMFLFH